MYGGNILWFLVSRAKHLFLTYSPAKHNNLIIITLLIKDYFAVYPYERK